MVCAVNRFWDEPSGCGDCSDAGDFSFCQTLQDRIDHFSSPMQGDQTEAAMRLLKGDEGFMCQYDDIPDFETVWSSIFDLGSLAVYRADGDPRTAPLLRINRLRAIVKGV